MILSVNVIEMLCDKCQGDVRTAHGVEVLALDMERVTGERLGVNTLKRLLGRIADDRSPRETTLNIIANYLGFPDWEVLQLFEQQRAKASVFSTVYRELRTTHFDEGNLLEITYLPNRRVVLRSLGQGRFEVAVSKNSKLASGDQLSLPIVVEGFPLIAHEVVRNGELLGTFTAGREQGIKFKILTDTSVS